VHSTNSWRRPRRSGLVHRSLRVRLPDRLFPRDPGELGSRPNAPATFLEAGIDRSGYRAPASFCAMDRLPALCDVCRSRRSSSGCSPTRPAASSGGGELVSIGGCSSSVLASASGDRRLLIPADSGCCRSAAGPRPGLGFLCSAAEIRSSSPRRRLISRFSTSCSTFSPCRSRPATL
jgi:hypothetical protein